MPKTKTPQHPNSRKAWKRISLRGRLQLVQRTIGNIDYHLDEIGLTHEKSNLLRSTIPVRVAAIERRLAEIINTIEELFELNPIKTKD